MARPRAPAAAARPAVPRLHRPVEQGRPAWQTSARQPSGLYAWTFDPDTHTWNRGDKLHAYGGSTREETWANRQAALLREQKPADRGTEPPPRRTAARLARIHRDPRRRQARRRVRGAMPIVTAVPSPWSAV